MSEWWEQGYPGGPMVAAPPLPRPLYPPDATRYGKKPSADGPDVIAYKRAVSRAGRWPWQAFDDSFSNGFSHGGGQGGNVGQTGVAGIQRQQHLDATGWLGTKTYNTLRSIRIPAGLPHAGEPALDAYGVELLNEAYERFGGSEPADLTGWREAVLDRARSQLGYTESPAGSNLNKYGEWYGGAAWNGQPWCAMFCTWAHLTSGAAGTTALVRGERYAYCPYLVGDARAGRYGLRVTDDPQPADLVVYDWSRDGTYDHVGVFVEWIEPRQTFLAYEGNTSPDAGGDQSNGGQVCDKVRSVGGQATVFVSLP